MEKFERLTFISGDHNIRVDSGTDCGRLDHLADGASYWPLVRPSYNPSLHPDCKHRLDLRTMAETLHVTMVRTLIHYWHAGNGQAGHPLIDSFFPSSDSFK